MNNHLFKTQFQDISDLIGTISEGTVQSFWKLQNLQIQTIPCFSELMEALKTIRKDQNLQKLEEPRHVEYSVISLTVYT